MSRRHRGPDRLFAAMVVLLALGGVIVSGSARAFQDAAAHPLPVGLVTSLVHLALGVALLLFVMVPDYHLLARPRVAWGLFVGTVGLLLLPFFFAPVANTWRWIRIGGLSLQPSELAKPVLVAILAAALARAGDRVRTWEGLVRPLVLGGMLAALVLLGRDLGTPVLYGLVTLGLVTAAGARWRHLAALLVAGAILFAGAASLETYRLQRLTAFLHCMDGDAELSPAMRDTCYQLRQSLVALGSGGIAGKGLGRSTQKAFFLPEAENDFVFAVLGEELGFLGSMAVIGLFLGLAWRSTVVARRAVDPLGRYLALGAGWFLAIQALVHAGVTTGLLPTKGLPLPFFSAGGSSMLASFALAGIVLNVSLRTWDSVAPGEPVEGFLPGGAA